MLKGSRTGCISDLPVFNVFIFICDSVKSSRFVCLDCDGNLYDTLMTNVKLIIIGIL